MLNFLNKPYPFNDDLKYNTKVIFFISIGAFAFLVFLEPFNINLLETREKYYLITGFCLITFVSLSLNLLLLPSLFSNKFSSADWNVKKEILWNLWILFTILVSYFFFCNSLKIMEFNFYMVIKVILTSIVPISVLIVINQNKILRSHLKFADELNKKLKDNKFINEKIINFNSDYQKDSLAVKVSLLLLIRSANNYIEVFWKEGKVVKNQMVRCSMTSAEELLKEHKFIFKCHRCFMVNIRYIDKIEGNSQGYKLFFENVAFPVPVSKNFAVKLQELI
jgi:hypothetical protein